MQNDTEQPYQTISPAPQPAVSPNRLSTSEIMLAVLAGGIIIAMLIPRLGGLFIPIIIFAIIGFRIFAKDSKKAVATASVQGTAPRSAAVTALIVILKVIIGVAITYFVGMGLIILFFIILFSMGGGHMD